MKGTAVAHPIQGLLKYHGLWDSTRNIPYHDSISVCTAPSRTKTTVEFGYDRDTAIVNEAPIDEEGKQRVRAVLDIVRERSGIDSGARVESVNSFESNVGLGASASAFAALARAASDAAGLELSQRELSALARRGAASAARSVVGGFAHLRSRRTDDECVAERIPAGFDEDIRIVVGYIPEYKFTSKAHSETPQSPYFDARLAGIHQRVAEFRDAIRRGQFETTFELAERDSLELLAVTMTGPDSWVYWSPGTLELLDTARNLRADGIPVYFSADTGATAYLNTTAAHVETVRRAVESLGIETRTWRVAPGVRASDSPLF